MASTQFEFNVMMFGGKRTGKTSVLAAMQECFEEKFKGVGLTITPDDDKVTKLPVLIAQGATYNMRFLLILGLYCVILST